LLLSLVFLAASHASEAPKTWIDADTGHRVVRLTTEPDSASLYFNQNGYTPDGRDLIYTTPNGIAVLNLETRATRIVVPGRGRVIEAGRKNRTVYFIRDGAVHVAGIDTGAIREIGKLPRRGSVATVNADETLLAGAYIEGDGADYGGRNRQTGSQGHSLDQPRNKGQVMEERLAARLPMGLFVMDTKSGATKTILQSTDWLNHFLFSPTDPTLLMYCHEGPWHKVDRIWTIRTDGTGKQLIHKRTMAMEIAGHEFWSKDGKTVWYDVQTPRGEDFWVAGYRVDTGERIWYHLQRNEWSIHFNVTRDEKVFCGDGGDPGQVARAPDGQWIYLFRAELIQNRGVEDKNLIQPGVFRAERLVNMSKHNYRLEPNVSFTPDEKWVVFRSNMFGPTYVFAAEVAKAAEAGTSQ
jgi:oligogalacturonide lyase